jgi:hypothetical protein
LDAGIILGPGDRELRYLAVIQVRNAGQRNKTRPVALALNHYLLFDKSSD